MRGGRLREMVAKGGSTVQNFDLNIPQLKEHTIITKCDILKTGVSLSNLERKKLHLCANKKKQRVK